MAKEMEKEKNMIITDYYYMKVNGKIIRKKDMEYLINNEGQNNEDEFKNDMKSIYGII